LLLHLGNKSHILKSEVCRKAEGKNKTADGKQMRQLTQNVRWPKGKRRNGKMKEERPEQSEGNHFRFFLFGFPKAKVADDAVAAVELVSVGCSRPVCFRCVFMWAKLNCSIIT